MKYLSFLLLGLLANTAMLCGQVKPKAAQPKTSTKPAMKDQIRQYWFVLLKTGPNTDADSTSKEILFDKHMANIVKLYNDGILKVAGPFGKNDNEWRGLFVLDCATREEAEDYLQTDAAIAAGLLTAEITPWYTAPTASFAHGKPKKPVE
jgi:uncharacterized protein YciI